MSRFFGSLISRTRCIIVIAALLLAVIPQASANLAEFSSAQLIYSGDDQFIVLTLTGDYKVQPSSVTPTSVWTIKQGTKRYDVAEQSSGVGESGWPRGLYLLITQVASVYLTISVIIVAMRNKTTLISNPAAVTA